MEINRLLQRLSEAEIDWPGLLLLAAAATSTAANPVCCKLFGLDATPILGDGPAVCGEVIHADEPERAEELAREHRRRAADCVREARRDGRPFVYTYRLLVWPDVDLVVQAVAGTQGEKLLLKMGNHRNENLRMAEVCAALEVLPDGRIDSHGCTERHPLLERLRAPGRSR